MARKKYIRRRIVKQNTLGERFPLDIEQQMQEILVLEQMRYKYVRFGLTTDIKAEYDKRKRCDDIQWSSMKVYFQTPYRLEAHNFDAHHKDKDNYTQNHIKFTQDIFEAALRNHFVYVMVGRRKKPMKKNIYTFVDLFAGIGGFHQAMHSIGGKCVYASEWDKYARLSYEANYNEIEPGLFKKDTEGRYQFFNEDINDANPQDIPDFDVCCAGFPCQAFSIAGLKRGFEDTRGTLFFNVANIVKCKKEEGHAPKVLFMENVKGLKIHDKGNTLKVILATLEELGYGYKYEVLNAKYFGIPQNRERLFIIAWDKDQIPDADFQFPYGIDSNGETIFSKDEAKQRCIETHVSDIFEPRSSLDNVEDKNSIVTISDKMWIGHQERKKRNKANGKGFGFSLFKPEATYCSTISARYWKDGSEILIDQTEFGLNPRKLTPVEAGRLQGYNIAGNGWETPCSPLTTHEQIPYKIVVSKKEAYHQFGNSVAVPVIKRLAQEIKKQLL